jgi:hypothetical protein
MNRQELPAGFLANLGYDLDTLSNTHNSFICRHCAEDNARHYDFTWHDHSRVHNMCWTCSGVHRRRETTGSNTLPICQCQIDFHPTMPNLWLCSTCRYIFYKIQWRRITLNMAADLPVLDPLMPLDASERWIRDQKSPGMARNFCRCGRPWFGQAALPYTDIRQIGIVDSYPLSSSSVAPAPGWPLLAASRRYYLDLIRLCMYCRQHVSRVSIFDASTTSL